MFRSSPKGGGSSWFPCFKILRDEFWKMENQAAPDEPKKIAGKQ